MIINSTETPFRRLAPGRVGDNGGGRMRTVLVTGGSRGIGLAIATAFADQGDRVAIVSRAGRSPDPRLYPVQCDITAAADVDRAFTDVETALGPVQILVANAGIAHKATLAPLLAEEELTAVLDTNVVGTHRTVKRALRGMLRARHGRILIVSSVGAFIGPAGQSGYAASKAGLVGYSRSLVSELGQRGITINILAPGLTMTDMAADLPESTRKGIVDRIPMGRAATPADIAPAALFLASEGASYITGIVLPIDGGTSMGT